MSVGKIRLLKCLKNLDLIAYGQLKTAISHISVVIPVYKAEKCLQALLYERLKISLEDITQDFEIILVEDCGGDRSWDMIVELSQTDPRMKSIQFSRNFG